MVILFTVTRPAFAADEDDGLREATFDLVDESVTIRYRLNEENRITYAEVGSDVIEVIGNEIYLNGELIATITTEIIDGNSGTIEPRTGWMYSDECTFGDPEDYTRELDPKFHNITFKKGNRGTEYGSYPFHTCDYCAIFCKRSDWGIVWA